MFRVNSWVLGVHICVRSKLVCTLESVPCFVMLDRGSSSAGGPAEAGTPAIGLSTLSQGSVAASISTLTVSTKQSPKQRGDIDPMYPGPAPPPGHGKVGDMGELFQTAPPPPPFQSSAGLPRLHPSRVSLSALFSVLHLPSTTSLPNACACVACLGQRCLAHGTNAFA